MELNFAGGGDVDLEVFFGDDAGAVKGVVEPEVGGEAEDADGFDADVLIGGGVEDGGIGIVGDGAGKNIDCAAAGMGDADEREIDGFEGAVVVEIEACKLAGAELDRKSTRLNSSH